MGKIAARLARQQIGGGHPSFDLNFVAGAWPPGLSFSRASGATETCWARYGDNIVTNGDFASGASWTLSGATITGGALVANAAGSAVFATGVAPFVTGRMYRITFSITAYTSGQVSANLYQAAGTPRANVGTYSEVIVAPSGPGEINIQARVGGGFVGTIDNIVVQELCIWTPGMEYLGPELVTNGDFSAGASGWVATTGTLSVTNGIARVTSTAAAQDCRLYTAISTVVGRTYQVTGKLVANTGGTPAGLSVGNGGGFTTIATSGGGALPREASLTFVAQQTTQYVWWGVAQDAGQYFECDNVSVKECLAAGATGWLGPELVGNPSVTGTSGYTAAGATIAAAGGELVLTGASATYPEAFSDFSTSVGRVYAVSVTRRRGTSANNAGFLIKRQSGLGNITSVISSSSTSQNSAAAQFTALDAQSRLSLVQDSGAADTGTVAFSGISVREQCFTLMNVLLPANVPRIAYDPATGACLGARVEPQRTNLLTFSQAAKVNFTFGTGTNDQYSGFGAGASMPGGTRPGPDGGAASMEEVLFNGTTQTFGRRYTGLTASTTYTVSMWLATLSGTFRLKLSRTNTSAWATATVSNEITVTTVPVRVSLTFTTGVGETVADLNIGYEGKTPYVLPATGSVYTFGWQLEQAPEASSYIPTAGAAATRAADVPPAVSGTFASGTFVMEYTPLSGYANDSYLSSGDEVCEYLARRSQGAGGVGTWNGSIQVNSGLADSIGAVNKYAVTWVGANLPCSVSVNGSTPATHATGGFQTKSLIVVGGGAGLGAGRGRSGYMRRLRYYPRGMPLPELQAVTKP